MTKETIANIGATIVILIIVGGILEIIIFDSIYIFTGILILLFITLFWLIWLILKEFFRLIL